MIVRKKKSINLKLHRPLDLATCKLIKTFSILIKQCYFIIWSVEKTETRKNPKVAKTKYGRIMLLSKCTVCDLGPLLFQRYQQVNTRYKMNEIVSKFLLAGDKFMPEMHLRELATLDKSGFTYSAYIPFTKKKNKETQDSLYIYQNQLDKACFQHTWLMGIFKI